jgi:hypothetical protein
MINIQQNVDVENATLIDAVFDNASQNFIRIYTLKVVPNVNLYFINGTLMPIITAVYYLCLAFISNICRHLNHEAAELNKYCEKWIQKVKQCGDASELTHISAWHGRLSYAITCADRMFSAFAGFTIGVLVCIVTIILFLMMRSEDLMMILLTYGFFLLNAAYALVRIIYEPVRLYDNVSLCVCVCVCVCLCVCVCVQY